MNILAVIPARKGSKGVKDKNIKKINDVPLISFTIRSAIKSKLFADIVVSTDSEIIKGIAEKEGASVPFIRSDDLSHDTALAVPVIQDAVINIQSLNNKKYDAVCMLQPTSPLRSEADYNNVVELFDSDDVDSVISVVEVNQHPYKMVRKSSNDLLMPFLDWPIENPPRQQLPKLYTYNGAFYLSKYNVLMNENTFKGANCKLYEMPESRSVNIDTENDFLLAASIIKNKINKDDNG